MDDEDGIFASVREWALRRRRATLFEKWWENVGRSTTSNPSTSSGYDPEVAFAEYLGYADAQLVIDGMAWEAVLNIIVLWFACVFLFGLAWSSYPWVGVAALAWGVAGSVRLWRMSRHQRISAETLLRIGGPEAAKEFLGGKH